MERRNVGMKGKSPKQGLTNAKDLPMEQCCITCAVVKVHDKIAAP